MLPVLEQVPNSHVFSAVLLSRPCLVGLQMGNGYHAGFIVVLLVSTCICRCLFILRTHYYLYCY